MEKKLKQEKELEECSFFPKINEKERRPFEEFLENQQKHMERKEKFKEQQLKRKEEEETKRLKDPVAINYKFKAKKEEIEKNVHERLFRKNKVILPINEMEQKLAKKLKLDEETVSNIYSICQFIPKIDDKSKRIAEKRDDKGSHLLFKDALRRQQKEKEQAELFYSLSPRDVDRRGISPFKNGIILNEEEKKRKKMIDYNSRYLKKHFKRNFEKAVSKLGGTNNSMLNVDQASKIKK